LNLIQFPPKKMDSNQIFFQNSAANVFQLFSSWESKFFFHLNFKLRDKDQICEKISFLIFAAIVGVHFYETLINNIFLNFKRLIFLNDNAY
jgi:hypothetical protein